MRKEDSFFSRTVSLKILLFDNKISWNFVEFLKTSATDSVCHRPYHEQHRNSKILIESVVLKKELVHFVMSLHGTCSLMKKTDSIKKFEKKRLYVKFWKKNDHLSNFKISVAVCTLSPWKTLKFLNNEISLSSKMNFYGMKFYEMKFNSASVGQTKCNLNAHCV